MLGLLTLDYRKLTGWQRDPASFEEHDFENLKRSGITVFHPAVGFVNGDIYQESLKDLQGWNRLIGLRPDRFARIEDLRDLDAVKASGRIGIVLGLQNSAHFRMLQDVDSFYGLGQRISQLTYYNNALGGGSSDPQAGLTDFGAQVVQRMNELGMAVDLSHCSDRTTLDAIEVSKKPALITHSNCRALVGNNLRCKTDEAIRTLARKGGVFGITLVRPFVRHGGRATVEEVLDHFDHAISIAGMEHVGLGTDVDLIGRDAGPAHSSDLDGLEYTRKVFDVTEGLLRRRYTRSDIELILGGNFRRVIQDIWA